jgi:ribonuclease P/MRP protein subunit POP5
MLPTLREKRRYILFEVVSERKFTKEKVEKALYSSLLNLFGEYGFSLVNPKLIDFDEEKQYGAIKCAREEVQKMRASLALVSKIDETPVAIHVKGVSGTLKKLGKTRS